MTDEERIRELMAEWRRASEGDDLDAVLALMTDDAVFLTAGNPPMTKQQFAAGFRGWAGKMRLEANQEVKEVRAAGDLGYAWSHITVTMTSIADGTKTRRAGEILTVFRRSAQGKWLLSRDANLIPPPSAQ